MLPKHAEIIFLKKAEPYVLVNNLTCLLYIQVRSFWIEPFSLSIMLPVIVKYKLYSSTYYSVLPWFVYMSSLSSVFQGIQIFVELMNQLM